MTEARKRWLEKWGALTAVVTVVGVALGMIAQIIVISRWTGALETKTHNTCEKVDVLEKGFAALPQQYQSKVDANRRWDGHMEAQREERMRADKAVADINAKLDRIIDMHMREKR